MEEQHRHTLEETLKTAFNTAGMYRGWIGSDGVPHVAICKE